MDAAGAAEGSDRDRRRVGASVARRRVLSRARLRRVLARGAASGVAAVAAGRCAADGRASLRTETAPLAGRAGRRRSTTARDDLDRFDRLLGSAEAISATVDRRVARGLRRRCSTPVIKTVALASGTEAAAPSRLRTEGAPVISRLIWFVAGAARRRGGHRLRQAQGARGGRALPPGEPRQAAPSTASPTPCAKGG